MTKQEFLKRIGSLDYEVYFKNLDKTKMIFAPTDGGASFTVRFPEKDGEIPEDGRFGVENVFFDTEESLSIEYAFRMISHILDSVQMLEDAGLFLTKELELQVKLAKARTDLIPIIQSLR
jgi:hypothetical protein